ncbi:MAG TPA: hypothetical protein VEO00_09850 [Actinomycetota bacterium]|nr:hypothetical protein [Actinomycetota bacterium]
MKRTGGSSALPKGGSDRPIRSYGEDRTCSICDTRLSRYNESGTCSVHRGWGAGPNARPSVPKG